MEPIVHGLELEFDGHMAFERRNAAEEVVKRTMVTYGLRGHPGFVIAAPDGEALWAQLGPSEEAPLRAAIEQYAATELGP